MDCALKTLTPLVLQYLVAVYMLSRLFSEEYYSLQQHILFIPFDLSASKSADLASALN